MKAKPSRALQVNLEDYRVDVTIDPKYHVIQEVMSKYGGLEKVLNTFLEELCHPRKNWQFIVNEAKTFSLGYFYDLKTHPKGPEAVRLYIEIAVEAIKNAREPEVKTDSFHNLYLLLQRFIKESGAEFDRFLPVVNYGFDEIKRFPEETFSRIAKSYYQVKKLAENFLKTVPPQTDFLIVNSLLINYFEYTFSYWLSENDALEWFKSEISLELPSEITELFLPISHARLKECRSQLQEIIGKGDIHSSVILEKFLELPGYGEIVSLYKGLPDKIFESTSDEKIGHHYKLIFLSHTMNISGLSNIHEEALREINNTTTWLIHHEDIQHIQVLIRKTFKILKKSMQIFPDTVLKSVLNIGMGVYETKESDLVNFFNQSVVKLGFQTPDFRGISEDWQIQSNVSHIQNIRTWIELIKLNPKWSKKLLSSLIINLSLSGVLIKDTDLFPRDITGFLNNDIQPVYNLTKQLMRLFPAYFNEIGAEGQLRDISTRIDEVCQRKDVLIYFLRKQSHVESSNKIISLIESTLEFWRTKSKEGLEPYLPQNIYEQIEQEGPYIDGVNKVINQIFKTSGLARTTDLLTLKEETLMDFANKIPEENKLDMERIALAISFYRLLNEKYCISSCEVEDNIAHVQSSIPINFNELRDILSKKDTPEKLSGLLDYLQRLKTLILTTEHFDVREDIYRKRHIAADIPSMYGSYHEAKFDALGLTFRLESIVNSLFEELVEYLDLSFINHATFDQIYKYLKLFKRSLNIDGISTKEFEHQLELLDKSLKIKLVTFTQYMDIFRGFTQVVRNIVSDYFNNIHKQNLFEILSYLPQDKLLPKYQRRSRRKYELFHKVSEIFLRDSIATSLGLQRLDLFLTRISNTLYKQAGKLPVDKHYLLLTYNPLDVVTSMTHPNSKIFDIVQLGNKGLNIIKMKGMGLPVPPGFIITTEVFRCREVIEGYAPANKNFRNQIDHQISNLEKLTGKIFGAPEDTLLISVRSGATVSQPGMMDSYLNVGMNEDIVNGIIKQTGQEWFAWDCYRRFLQSYGMSFGLKRDDFDTIINEFKDKYSVPLKKDFAFQQMKEVAIAYKELIKSKGIEVEESPREQLYIAIQRVLNSWNSDKARTFRKIMGISDDWGTAVTVQAMVFGNLSQLSGSGVLFTHSPKFSQDLLRPWGDYTIGNQGEDVVSGLVTTYPVSDYQAKMENRPVDYALENKFPEIYHALREIAKVLIYENQWSPQDIEFTFEGPQKERLYILQTRNMEMREEKKFMSFESASEMSAKFLGHGIGVSGGAMSGRVVFSLDDILHWRKIEPATSLILIRGDTVPDDIEEISAADGLLTARGGATSHAAIVADRLDKTCVVGCTDLVSMEKDKKFLLNQKVVNVGELISIDGSEGSIYLGQMKVKESG
jgi:pyruvate,orthophosphate dikinase